MKLYHALLAGMAALFLSSCDLTGTSEATPQIGIGAINITQQDTLGFKGNQLDTVFVGDTIMFQTIAFGRYNQLLELHIKSSDSEDVEFLWGDKSKLDSVFTAYEDGSFYMNGEYSELAFPFKYIIKKPVKDLELTVSVLTNASAEYNHTSLSIITPAKEAESDGTENGGDSESNEEVAE